MLEDKQHFATLGNIHRKVDGGTDTVMYLEGSDQHRGWFQSSLLESCGTRGRAPYDVVVTHGFTLAEDGRKMSKSLGNTIAPQDVIKDSGADILRLWVGSCDYWDDQRIGKEILKTTVETYRKLRNTIRWMLGTLHHFRRDDAVAVADMPELERLMLHELARQSAIVRKAYTEYDYKTVVATLATFMNTELSAFYFDIRKDTLYCDAPSSHQRKAALTAIDIICDAIIKWLAPVLSFTCEEAWRMYRPDAEPSVHLTLFPDGLDGYAEDALAAKWDTIRNVRRVVTGALEVERAAKRIGSSLEAAPIIYIADRALLGVLFDIDLADICITSSAEVTDTDAPAGAFTLPDVPGVAVVVERAQGRKCARSWKILPTVGDDPEYPDVSPRDADALAGVEGDGVGARDIMTSRLRLGIFAVVAALVLDQASKLWLLNIFEIGRRGLTRVTSFFDLVLAWNTGISYGWFSDSGQTGQFLLIGFKVVAVVVLSVWMVKAHSRLATLALGLIIGGAIGNAIDRLAYGAVVDFVLLHADIRGQTYNWYVFNLADVAIVAGVAALLYDSLWAVPAVKAALIPADTDEGCSDRRMALGSRLMGTG